MEAEDWKPPSEAVKLAQIFEHTDVAQLPDHQAREFLAREVNLREVPVAEQRRIMGEAWERFAPAECHQLSETAIRPLRRVRTDSPELIIQKPLTM